VVTLAEAHQEIRAAIEAGALLHSHQLCEEVLSFRPQNVETRLLVAEIDLEFGAHRAALDGFERVIAADPEASLAYAGLGIAHEALRDPAAALHWHSRALDLAPGNGQIRAERDRLFDVAYPGKAKPMGLSEFARARSLVDGGAYEEGAEAYRRVLLKEPGRTEIRLGLAEVLWMLGQDDEANALSRAILAASPSCVKARIILACGRADQGDVAGGRALLQETHAVDPECRIAGDLVVNSVLADWMTEDVDLPIVLDRGEAEEGLSADLPTWAGWMRNAIFGAFQVIVGQDPAAAIRERAAARREFPRWASPTGPIGRRILAQQYPDLDFTPSELEAPDSAMVSQEIMEIPAAALPVDATIITPNADDRSTEPDEVSAESSADEEATLMIEDPREPKNREEGRK